MQEHLCIVRVRSRVCLADCFRLCSCVFVRVGRLPESVLVFIKLSEQMYMFVQFLPKEQNEAT